MISNLRRACVIGWPIAHSRSPLIHGTWLKQHGIAGAYTREPVKPEDLDSFLDKPCRKWLRRLQRHHSSQGRCICQGASPLPAAEAVGAANTLWLEGDTLCADSTDGDGFMANLKATVPASPYRAAP